MMIKVSNEFLDFDEQIEVEKQIKLFEDIASTDGDFSYAFDIPKTLHNTKLLQNPFPDNINKPVYQTIPATLLGDSGAELYKGYLRIERVTHVFECSFFAGNNNWFARITGLMSDLDLSAYDVDVNEVNIIDSWSLTEGLVFPLVDNGGLITRSYHQLKLEDFVGAFYVKTLFNKVFVEAGIKIKGELLEDWRYQNLICQANSKDQNLLDQGAAYVEKSNAQAIPINSATKVTWDNDSTDPYFDNGDNFNLISSEYIPDYKCRVDLTVNLTYTGTGFGGLLVLAAVVNGVWVRTSPAGAPQDQLVTVSMNININLNPGDVLHMEVLQINTDGDAGTLHEGTIKITPTYIYRTIGSSAVPNWTKQKFVSNVLRMFNVLSSYNEGDATLTLTVFEKIKSKPTIDLSEYISNVEIDYSEFISDYAQRSRMGYQQIEFEELKNYNQGKFFKYGQGVIEVDNDFLEPDGEILLSDFANPIAYLNPVFDMSMEKTNLIELDEGEEFPFSNVGNDGYGDGAFNIGNTDAFFAGDLVRVSDSTNPVYNGDWVVKSVDGIHVVFNGLPFDTGATGNLIKLNYKYSSSEDVFIFINVPNYQVSKFSNAAMVFDSGSFYPITFSNVAIAYFDLINTGRQINRDFIYSLSFGGIDDPLHYQVTMIDSYFRLFSQVLNDPVKLFCTCTIPYALFTQIDFLSPIKIRTMETTNSYYLNRITGYKESYLPTTIELIKI